MQKRRKRRGKEHEGDEPVKGLVLRGEFGIMLLDTRSNLQKLSQRRVQVRGSRDFVQRCRMCNGR